MNNPPEKKMRVDVEWFARQMQNKLEANIHKGGWDDAEYDYLLRRLLEETAELVEAILRQDNDAVISESTDVANFLLMISEKAMSTRSTGIRTPAPSSRDGDPDGAGEDKHEESAYVPDQPYWRED